MTSTVSASLTTLGRVAATWRALAGTWERMAIYMPLLLMGLLALGTYWLARNSTSFSAPQTAREVRHEIDYFMKKFSVKTFDEAGRLKTEIFGDEGRHFADTDILEIDQARVRSLRPDGGITVATGNRAYTNGDASEVQLTGNARVVRDAWRDASGRAFPRLEFRGEFLHAFLNEERVTSHKPVVLIRGLDQFTGDTFDYDNLGQVANMKGRVRGVMMPRLAPSAPSAPSAATPGVAKQPTAPDKPLAP